MFPATVLFILRNSVEHPHTRRSNLHKRQPLVTPCRGGARKEFRIETAASALTAEVASLAHLAEALEDYYKAAIEGSPREKERSARGDPRILQVRRAKESFQKAQLNSRRMNNVKREAEVRRLWSQRPASRRTENSVLAFYGWLYTNRHELLPRRKAADNQYQGLFALLEGLILRDGEPEKAEACR